MADFLEWATHGVRRGRLELDSRPAVLIYAVVFTLAVVAALYLGLVSRTAAQGRHIEQLQMRIFHVQRENEQLAVEIAEVSAIPRLIEKAEQLGFAPPEKVVFLEESD